MDQIVANDCAPIIEQCCACLATVLLKVQIGKGFTIAGESFAKGLNLADTVWRPIVDPGILGHVQVVWLESNPKRAALRLLGMARNVAAEQTPATN